MARSPPDQDIKSVIAKSLATSEDALGDDRLLSRDLGVGYERAKKMFDTLAKHFGVKGEIDLTRYFEGFHIHLAMAEFSPIMRLLYPRLREQWHTAPPRPDIPVGHLVAVVRAGIWTEPPPLKLHEPLVWVGKEVLTPIFKAGNLLLNALSYVVAAGVIWLVTSSLLIGCRSVIDGRWLGAVYHAFGASVWSFVLLLMFENTQRSIRARFGLSWDWRCGRLRDPRPVPIGD